MPALTPLYLDTPAGQADIPVTARDLRAQADSLQAGVVGATHLRPTASGMNVAIQPGTVYVPDGQTVPTLYRCEWSGAATSSAIAAADGTSPRVDQVIARVRDLNVDGGTARDWRIETLTGTPAGGATLDNRTGAAAMPARAVRLADVLVPAGASSLSAANVRDRRPWARGAHARWAGNPDDTSFSNQSTTVVTIDESARRVETGGGPVIVTFHCTATTSSNTGLAVAAILMDGTEIARQVISSPTANGAYAIGFGTEVSPAAGSHVFAAGVAAYTSGIATSFYNSAAIGKPFMVVDELVGTRAPNA